MIIILPRIAYRNFLRAPKIEGSANVFTPDDEDVCSIASENQKSTDTSDLTDNENVNSIDSEEQSAEDISGSVNSEDVNSIAKENWSAARVSALTNGEDTNSIASENRSALVCVCDVQWRL